MAQTNVKWIRVVGTGKSVGLPTEVILASERIGRALATAGYGLVSGGWPGVDHIVSREFAEALRITGRPLSDYLLQFVTKGKWPDFRGGHVEYVDARLHSWIESVKHSDAIVLVGGEGATYETYVLAMQEQKPVFPLAGTNGDAEKVYRYMLDSWDSQPIAGIEENAFQQLAHSVKTDSDAIKVVDALVALLAAHFRHRTRVSEEDRRVIFISYSHKDREWMEKLRTMLSPLEGRWGRVIFDDTAIEAGEKWRDRIEEAIDSTKVAVFLISPHALASSYVVQEELAKFEKAAQLGQTTITWVYLSGCLYDEMGLDKYQAANDTAKPLDMLSPAEQNLALRDICKKIRLVYEK